jgi:AcrR family transcriptional regulator
MAEVTEPASLPATLRRVWGVEPTRGNRGPKASLTVDEIVDTAIALGREEGVAGVSLTRVANRLGVTTNALYRYIDSRDELHVLARERALGPPGPGSRSRRWQTRVSAWAHALRARYIDQPWLVDLQIRLPLTPHALAWFEALLEALAPGPFTLAEKVRISGLIDGFVRANAVAARDLAAADRPLREPDPAWTTVGELLASRGLHRVAEVFAAGLYQEPTDRRTVDDFTFGLHRIIAGVEALTTTGGTPQSRRRPAGGR